jgi:arabinofuranosyltransferase
VDREGINHQTRQGTLLTLLLILLIGIVVLRNAWVCDDAYISFRTVDNLVNGFGLTWNTDERVQGFTNPLWVLLMSLAYAFTRDVYYTSIFISLAVTILAIVLVAFRISRSTAAAILGITIILFSKAFIDYSTSGLENPLSHLLLAAFVYTYFAREPNVKTLFYLSLLASLGTLNRMDTLLLYLPAVIYVAVKVRSHKGLFVGLTGFAPFVLWELFSIAYYGFPFPNTYYAKLHTGIPASELVSQGLIYFVDTLYIDPLTLIVTLAGIIVVVVPRNWRNLPIALGIVLYLLYVVRIGGDFMSGRFFAAPFFFSVMLISRYPLPKTPVGRFIPFAVVLLVGLTSPRTPLLSDKTYGTTGEGGINEKGIADERGWYYQSTGLLRVQRNREMPAHEWIERGRRLSLKEQPIHSESVVGFVGFAAGPKVHVIDFYGLTEPLLGRLPMTRKSDWRIGHFSRLAPYGYVKTLKGVKNLIADSGVAAYYDNLSLITRGDIFDPRRWIAIWKMNTGAYEHLLEPYLNPPLLTADYSEINQPKVEGTPWDQEGNIEIRRSGLRICLDTTYHSTRIEISLDHNDYYTLVFYSDSTELGIEKIMRQKIPQGGLRVDTLNVPVDAQLAGYNYLEVYPVQGDDLFSVGHVRLLPDTAK